MPRVLVASPFGRTGNAVFFAAHEAEGIELAGGLVSERHRGMTVGQGRGICVPPPLGTGGEEVCVPMALGLETAPTAEVVIEFTSPEAAVRLAVACAEVGLALVSGATGLSAEQEAAIARAAERVPVVRSGNYSLGVTVLAALVERAAATLGEAFDVEVRETHHRDKKDSPSGTALLLGEAAARGLGTSLESAAEFARHGRVDASRPRGEIGFAVSRGGGVYGDHDVSFLGAEETVTLGHRALSREVFARGALRAASWAAGRAPGLYTMRDVLGL